MVFNSATVFSNINYNNWFYDLISIWLEFSHLKFNIRLRCNVASIDPMHRNKPRITYLLIYLLSMHYGYVLSLSFCGKQFVATVAK